MVSLHCTLGLPLQVVPFIYNQTFNMKSKCFPSSSLLPDSDYFKENILFSSSDIPNIIINLLLSVCHVNVIHSLNNLHVIILIQRCMCLFALLSWSAHHFDLKTDKATFLSVYVHYATWLHYAIDYWNNRIKCVFSFWNSFCHLLHFSFYVNCFFFVCFFGPRDQHKCVPVSLIAVLWTSNINTEDYIGMLFFLVHWRICSLK